jgi:two-component system CheB/CheR fusion protein
MTAETTRSLPESALIPSGLKFPVVGIGAFDVVITDITMPGMDGIALLQALRRGQGEDDVPAIAISGMGRPVGIQRALGAGFRHRLTKPISLERLLQALDEVLGASSPAARAS